MTSRRQRILVSFAFSAALTMALGFASAGAPDKTPKPKDGTLSGRERALLRARLHRVTADLIDAKAADSPDREKIGSLTEELQSIRQEIGLPRAESGIALPRDDRPQPRQGRGFQWRGGRGAGPGPGRGFGHGRGRGRGGPMGADPAFQKDRDTFHFLLANRDSIARKVKKLEDGIESLTESDDPKVASVIQEHVESMYKRVETGNPIHMRDPLFAAVFSNASKIAMKVQQTEKGVRVIETSSDPYVAKLIQAHAGVVNLFLANGHAEVQKNHAVPTQP
jgi:hypothetical protein